MEYIFIDTSVFEANNFLESTRINEIIRLSEEGYIKIVLPIITYHEIINRATKNIKEAASNFRRYKNETRVLRNIDSLKSDFDYINTESVIAEFKEMFDRKLARAQYLLIDYPTVNIRDVFEKYFKEEFPFGKGDKKHEFPDAFALLTVENWCKETHNKCYVFSKDKDLLNYKSVFLNIVQDYYSFLDWKLRWVEEDKQRTFRLTMAKILFDENRESLEKEIEQWLFEQLDDLERYHYKGFLNVHDININGVSVSLDTFQIVGINDIEINIQSKAYISYDVEVEVDDENSGWYDDEDKEWHYFDTTIDLFKDEQVIFIDLKVDFPIAGDDYMDIKIYKINDGLNLKL